MSARIQRPLIKRRPPGFALVELLIASGIVLVIALGVIPLFARAQAGNTVGGEATVVTAHARGAVEEAVQQGFNHWRLSVDSGLAQETRSHLSEGVLGRLGDEEWILGPVPPGVVARFERLLTVRQYQLTGALDSDGDGIVDRLLGLEDQDADGVLDRPLAAGAPLSVRHFKEIEVRVVNRRQTGVLGVASGLDLRLVKAF